MLINLTPHEVVVAGYVFPPSGKVARIETMNTGSGMFYPENDTDRKGIPVVSTKIEKIVDLPDEDGYNQYIVSGMVLSAFPERYDLFVPHDLIRDEKGIIIGAKMFRTNIFKSILSKS